MRAWTIIFIAALTACGGGSGSSPAPSVAAGAAAPATSAATTPKPSAAPSGSATTPPVASPAPTTNPTITPTSAPVAAATGNPTVTVDFASTRTQTSMSGFLHGELTIGHVSMSLIAPLAPSLWRGSLLSDAGDEAALHALWPALTYVDILSDDYGYPGQGKWSSTGSTTPPYNLAPYAGNGATAWAARVTATVGALCSHANTVFEAWNEPDVSGASDFFYGTEAQADATMAAAYGASIATCPGSLAVAPATVSYDKTFIADYLAYCVTQGCAVNAISMHDSVDTDIPQIATDLANARTTLLQSSTYAALHIAKIYDDESVGPTSDRVPGDIVAYLYYLEAGGADGAAKACWSEPSGANECFDGSVDGIIDPSTGEPRAAWWSYKYYADGVASRVASSTIDPSIVGIASRSSATAGAAQIVIGAIAVNGNAPSTGTPIVMLQGLNSVPALAGLTAVTVRVTTIAATDVAPVPALPAATTTVVAVTNGSTAVKIPIAEHAAVVMTISAK